MSVKTKKFSEHLYKSFTLIFKISSFDVNLIEIQNLEEVNLSQKTTIKKEKEEVLILGFWNIEEENSIELLINKSTIKLNHLQIFFIKFHIF